MKLPRSLSFALCFWAAVFSYASATEQQRPNVFLIYVDDLGYGDLACYGHPVIQTPNLDALAAEGIKFTQYYAPSALCSPSRAGLLTGRTPYRTGIKSWIPHNAGVYLPESELTIAEIFQDAGYATALIGKWHLNSDLGNSKEPQPMDHGFDYSYGNNAYQIPTNRNPTNLYLNGEALGEVEGFTAQLYADASINWLEARKAEDAPFFLYLSMNEPHTTIENPDEFNALYAEYTHGEIVPIPSGGPIPTELLVARGPGEYYANITYMDHELGRVLAALKRLELESSTIVVFTSDNGPVTSNWRTWWEVNAYGETGGYRGRKHGLYEGGLRVPAIIKYQGVIKAGSETDAPVIGMDLFVTLLNQAGLAIPEDRIIDGIDIEPLFQVDAFDTERSFYWALPTDEGKDYAFRRGAWKLILNSELEPIELYNLSADALELFNLIEKEPEQREEIHEAFKEYHQSVMQDFEQSTRSL